MHSCLSLPSVSLSSQGYHLQTTRDMRPHHNVTLDPATTFHPPPFRSRNQSYMRAVSTLSQASCVSQVSLRHTHRTEATPGDIQHTGESRESWSLMWIPTLFSEGLVLEWCKASTGGHVEDLQLSVILDVNCVLILYCTLVLTGFGVCSARRRRAEMNHERS